jgi:hypothetical protein
VILSVGGTAVNTPRDVVAKVQETAVGSSLSFQVARGNQTLTLNVTVAEPPAAAAVKRGLEKIRKAVPGLRGRLPELEGIERGQLFNHFRGGQLNFTDRNNNEFSVRIVVGTVAEISDTSVTVSPNGGGANQTFTITDQTRVHRAAKRDSATTPQVGDRVTVTAVGNDARHIVAWPSP